MVQPERLAPGTPDAQVLPLGPGAHPKLTSAERRQVVTLLVAVLLVSLCAIIYQLQIAAISSYLLGNSVRQFSFTIGLFMFSLGVGSWLSKLVHERLLERLLFFELLLSLVGGLASYVLFSVNALTGVYEGAMIGMTLAVGSLVGLEIPLLARLVRRYGPLRVALAEVLTWDYVGALIGAVVFPLVLLPHFGLLATSPIVGLLNVVVAILLATAFWPDLRGRRSWIAGVVLTAAILAGGLVLAEPASGAIDRRMYLDEVLIVKQSPYQKLVVTKYGSDTRLFLNGNLQFSTADEHRYHDSLVHPAMSAAVNREKVLILGGGDGLAARDVLTYPDVKEVTLVDIDPAVTELASTYPPIVRQNRGALKDPRVRIRHEDAFQFLENAPASERFGVILSDLPDPTTESLSKLYSKEFYRIVRQHLAMGGLIAVQSTSPFFAREAYWSVAATMAAAGLKTLSYHVYVPSFGDWGFHLAGHLKPPVPKRFRVKTRFLTPEVLRAALVFDRDLERVDVPINSLQRPVLQELYLAGWSRWTVP